MRHEREQVEMHNQSDYGYLIASSECRACGRSELNCCDGKMPKEGEFVRIKRTGEKGRWIATYRAYNGTTLLIKTPQGDRCCDMRVGDVASEYLWSLPR